MWLTVRIAVQVAGRVYPVGELFVSGEKSSSSVMDRVAVDGASARGTNILFDCFKNCSVMIACSITGSLETSSGSGTVAMRRQKDIGVIAANTFS